MASPAANRVACGGLRAVSSAVTARISPSFKTTTHDNPLLRVKLSTVHSRPLFSPIFRPFSSSVTLLKKRKPAAASHGETSSPPSSNPQSGSTDSSKPPQQQQQQHQQPDPENPLDFSALTSAYAPIDARFKAQLQALLHGGRFNVDQLGALPVTVPGAADAAAAAAQTFPLRELAQVVPRPGRTISLLATERAYIKPIMSAVQASRDFNQQPQRAEGSDLELVLRVELERRDEVVRRAREACQGWRERVRQARTRHEKVLQEWKRAKTVLPDVVRKAEREMQKVQDKKMKEIDQEESQTVKQLERNSS